MIQFTASWRFTVIVLAIACLGNWAVMFTDRQVTSLTTAVASLSVMCSAALLASLVLKIRKFTLLLTAITMWLQVYESLSAPIQLASKFRSGSIMFALGLLAFGAWVHAMRHVWASLATRPWRIVLI